MRSVFIQSISAIAAMLFIFNFKSDTLLADTVHKAFGPDVLVGDIVKGCPPEICALAVTPSPLPGRTKTVNRREVVDAVRRAGGDTGVLRIPERVRVSRPSKIAKAAELQKQIREAIKSVLPAGVVLEEMGTISDLEVPKLGYAVSARWTGDEKFRRRASIPLEFLSEGTRFRTDQVSVLLAWETAIPVAVRNLNPGEVISDRDIRFKTVRLDSDTDRTVIDRAAVVGYQVQSTVTAGAFFKTEDIKRVPVVREGERVSLESVFGLVKVSALAVSRQDGAVGERVRVVTLAQNRLVWARILGPGRAMVVP